MDFAHHLHAAIATYGYLAIFVIVAMESAGIPMPGETVLVTGAILAGEGTLGKSPLLQEISQPGVGPVYAPGSPLVMDGAAGPRAAPELGADTGSVLTGLLGLTATEVRALAQRGIIGGS